MSSLGENRVKKHFKKKILMQHVRPPENLGRGSATEDNAAADRSSLAAEDEERKKRSNQITFFKGLNREQIPHGTKYNTIEDMQKLDEFNERMGRHTLPSIVMQRRESKAEPLHINEPNFTPRKHSTSRRRQTIGAEHFTPTEENATITNEQQKNNHHAIDYNMNSLEKVLSTPNYPTYTHKPQRISHRRANTIEVTPPRTYTPQYNFQNATQPMHFAPPQHTTKNYRQRNIFGPETQTFPHLNGNQNVQNITTFNGFGLSHIYNRYNNYPPPYERAAQKPLPPKAVHWKNEALTEVASQKVTQTSVQVQQPLSEQEHIENISDAESDSPKKNGDSQVESAANANGIPLKQQLKVFIDTVQQLLKNDSNAQQIRDLCLFICNTSKLMGNIVENNAKEHMMNLWRGSKNLVEKSTQTGFGKEDRNCQTDFSKMELSTQTPMHYFQNISHVNQYSSATKKRSAQERDISNFVPGTFVKSPPIMNLSKSQNEEKSFLAQNAYLKCVELKTLHRINGSKDVDGNGETSSNKKTKVEEKKGNNQLVMYDVNKTYTTPAHIAISPRSEEYFSSPLHMELSHPEGTLSALQYVKELEELKAKNYPTEFVEYYEYVTKVQIRSKKNPISFVVFLELHNGGRLKHLEDDYKNYLEFKKNCLVTTNFKQ